jgi:hypothetical protein
MNQRTLDTCRAILARVAGPLTELTEGRVRRILRANGINPRPALVAALLTPSEAPVKRRKTTKKKVNSNG